MSQMSKSRQRAESVFSKTQHQTLASSQKPSEGDLAIRARNEKTARLRELRMAKEAEDLASGATTTATKKSK